MIRDSRRRFLRETAAGVLACLAAGCGTLLYPERRGQPAGRFDWRVVALDGLGLIFFFIPGVVAFAVDFLNGTIYLPPEACGPVGMSQDSSELETVSASREQLTEAGIAKLVSEKIQRPVVLDSGKYLTCRMESIDEFRVKQKSFEGHSLNHV